METIMIYSFSYTKAARARLPLTIHIVCVDHLQEPIIRENGFNLFQWIFCEEGEGEFLIDGKKVILSPGDLLLTYPFEPHAYHALTDNWKVQIIGFSGPCCYEILKTLNMIESGIYHLSETEWFYGYMREIEDLYKKSVKGSNKNSSSALKALSKLCYGLLMDIHTRAKKGSFETYEPSNQMIRTLVSYIEEHYTGIITMDDLSELVHRSKGYISSIFKKEMHQTIIQYLNHMRIAHAKILLLDNPELKATEIASMVGFENPSYFGETFKKIVGMTPLEFRRR